MFSTPSVKSPETPPPPPKEEDKAVQEAIAAAAEKNKMKRGYRSTILSKNMMDSGAPALQTTLGS